MNDVAFCLKELKEEAGMQSGDELSKVRREIGRLPRGAARRIPTELGRRIGRVVRAGLDSGRTKTALANELDISMATLSKMVEAAGTREPVAAEGSAGFVQLESAVEPTGARIRLTDGTVIEGMRFDEIVAFAREMR